MGRFICFLFVCLFGAHLQAQDFVNGDLEHPYAVTAATPEGWQSVSPNVPYCLANSWITATPDITSSTGPNSNAGINAFPSSGNTFVSGLYASNDESLLFFHEGIEQVVYGLVPGATYDVCFDQAIIAQNSVSDRTGAWEVFVDSTSIGVSELSTNYGLQYGNPQVQWESQCLSFQASNESHLISFLPWDNDTLTQFIGTGNAGALRMGIDKIYIPPCYIPVDLPDTVFLCGPSDLVEVAPVIPQGSIGLWSNGTESLNIEIGEPGMYYLEASLLACTGGDSVMVVEIPIPSPSLGNDTLICEGESVLLSSQYSSGTFNWVGQNASSPSLNVSEPGIYILEVTQNGCTSAGAVSVQVQVPESNFDWESPNLLCEGESLFFEFDIENIAWQNFGNTNQVNIEAPGVYPFTFTDEACEIASFINVEPFIMPSSDLGENLTLCEGASINLEVALDAYSNVNWSTGSEEQSIEVVEEDLYVVEVTHPCGTFLDSIYISFDAPIPVDLGTDVLICDSSSHVLSVSPEWDTMWSTGSTESSITINNSQVVEVTQSNACGPFSSSVEVIYNSPPQGFDLPEDAFVCSGSSYSFEVVAPEGSSVNINGMNQTGITLYEEDLISIEETNVCGTWEGSFWVNQVPFPTSLIADTLACNGDTLVLLGVDDWNLVVNDFPLLDSVLFTESTELNLQLEQSGCIYETSAEWNFHECNYELVMPNVFTPNQDGDNESFRPLIMTGTFDLEMEIYNRWGQLLFEKQGLNSAWDGRLAGEEVAEGVYYYVVRSKDARGRWYEDQGMLTLLR